MREDLRADDRRRPAICPVDVQLQIKNGPEGARSKSHVVRFYYFDFFFEDLAFEAFFGAAAFFEPFALIFAAIMPSVDVDERQM